jgi:hypothetical protein
MALTLLAARTLRRAKQRERVNFLNFGAALVRPTPPDGQCRPERTESRLMRECNEHKLTGLYLRS